MSIPLGMLLIERGPDGTAVIQRADQSIGVSLRLLEQLDEQNVMTRRDGLVVFTGVDGAGDPREVAYREVGFDPTSAPEANEGGFLLLEREP